METYEIVVLEDARNDIEQIVDYIITEFKSDKIALAISVELWATIRQLDFMPDRFGIEEEPELAKRKIRHIKHKQYSIYYVIDETNHIVRVIRVKHALQDIRKFFRLN